MGVKVNQSTDRNMVILTLEVTDQAMCEASRSGQEELWRELYETAQQLYLKPERRAIDKFDAIHGTMMEIRARLQLRCYRFKMTTRRDPWLKE